MQISNSFEHAKSTKGASKDRRDKINAEIQKLRELLPLPANNRQKLSQLQLMALVCVYVRKATYFKNTLDCIKEEMNLTGLSLNNLLNGFFIMMTQNGKLLYISENVPDYLGHSMEDLLIQGDSVYDLIDNKDHQSIRDILETSKNSNCLNMETREFLCRISANKNARRQMRYGDQKLFLVSGHYYNYIPLSTTEIPVFLAVCFPVLMPDTKDSYTAFNCRVYTSQHSLDFKYLDVDKIAESHLGVDINSIINESMSWYDFIHPEDLAEVSKKHIALTTSAESVNVLLVRVLNNDYTSSKLYNWTHVILQLIKPSEEIKPAFILCTSQVLTESEARILHQNNWVYDNFSIQAKMQYGFQPNGLSNFAKASSVSSENGINSSTNSYDNNQLLSTSSPPLQQIVLNNNTANTSNGTKRSRNKSNSPNNPYYLNDGNINVKSRINSPEHINGSPNSLSSSSTAGSHTANSPLMSTIKTDLKYLTNENSNHSNSSTNLTSEAYSTASLTNYGINCLSPNNVNGQINNLSSSSTSSCILNNGHSLHPALNAMAPLDIKNEHNTSITEAAVAAAAAAGHTGPFNTHNLLQYSPHSSTLSSYSSFISPGSVNSTTSLFTHSPQQASSVITNTTPPATPPEIVHRHSSSSSTSSNNSSLNSNSSSLNGVVTNVTSNKRSLNSSSTNSLSSLGSARHSPEPKRAYLGQHSSISHYNSSYSSFNHPYAYNNGYNQANSLSTHSAIHQQNKFQTHSHQQQLIQQAHSNQINQATQQTIFNSQSPSHSQLHQQNTTATQQQYSFHHNRWLPIAANNFSELMPTMSGYYNAAVAHHPAHTSHHQFNQLTHHNQLNSAHQQILPNTVSTSAMAAAAAAAAAVTSSNVKNSNHHHSSINQNHHFNYHHHANSHLRTVAAVAGQKLSLFNKDNQLDQRQNLTNTEEISNAIAIY